MIVRSSAKYLGFFLGPESRHFQWVAPFKKYADRIVSIHQLGLPFRLAATRHNYYALPVLAYVGQLALPPPNICRFELSAILKALSLAGNSMTCKTAFSMDGLLGFSPSRPSVYLESCMLRSAFKTFEGFLEMHSELSDKARECSSLHLAYTEIKPPGWDAPAFCTNLAEAVKFKGLRHIYIQVVRVPRIIHNILITYLHGQGVGEGGGEVSEQ